MSEQEAFEEWAKGAGFASRLARRFDSKDSYMVHYVQDLWDGWKARAEYAATQSVQMACDRDAGYAQGYRDGYLEACPNCGHVKGGEPNSGEAKL